MCPSADSCAKQLGDILSLPSHHFSTVSWNLPTGPALNPNTGIYIFNVIDPEAETMELLEPSAMISSSELDFSWPMIAQPQPGKKKKSAPTPGSASADSACCRSGLEQKFVWTSLVGSSSRERKNPGNPEGKETSRFGVRESSFIENLLCTRHFQSGLQLCKAGIIILLPKLREIK